MPTLTELQETSERIYADLKAHEDQWGSDPATIPPGQRERRERLRNGFGNAVRALEDFEAREEKVEAVRRAAALPINAHPESGFGGGPGVKSPQRNRSNPWDSGAGDDLARIDSPTGLHARATDAAEYAPGLTDHGRSLLTDVIEGDDDPAASAFVLAATDPAYRSGFTHVLKDPVRGHLLWTAQEREAYARVEAARTALSTTDANGGYLVPFTLDPLVNLTNAGARNSFRQIARVTPTATNDWHGVSSAGVTAEWLAEGAVAADASPAFGRVTIAAHKAAAWIFGSYEVLQDTNLAQQLPELIADARANLENVAFATGSGSGAPKGIVTGVYATTGSRLATTTGSTFGLADLYAVQQELPARARNGRKPAMVANVAIINRLRAFDTAGGASYWTDLGSGQPASVLGLPLYESSGMVATTTTGSKFIVTGDFDKFQIVDRLGTSLVYDPIVKDATTGRPTGQGGWFAYWRTGSDVLDPSVFRVLVA